MSDLIDRQALLKQIDIDSDGEPGYYGDTWKFIDTIKSMPSAELGTNLAEVSTDCISRQAAIDAVNAYLGLSAVSRTIQNMTNIQEILERLPSAQPTFDARDTQYNLPIGTDLISRAAATDALRKMQTYKLFSGDDMLLIDQAGAQTELMLLPSAQPEIIRCRECKFASGDSRICMKFDHSPIGELDFCSFAERREVTT